MMQRALLLITGLLVMLLGMSPSLAAGGTPPLPAAYYGSVTYDDGSLVQAGAIEAVIDGTICGSISVSNGFYGSQNSGEQKLSVQYPEDVPGKIVHFMVNGVEAGQTVIWKSGDIIRFDLVVNKAANPKPLVASKAPTGAGEAKDAAVTVAFNTEINLINPSGCTIVDALGNPVSSVSIVATNKTTLNIGHADFGYSKNYTVSIAANTVQSVIYNTYNDAISWSFATAAFNPNLASINGKIITEGRQPGNFATVNVSLLDSSNKVQGQASSGSDGTYALENISPSTYTLVMTAPKYLEKRITGIVVAEGDKKQVSDATLKVGDVNGDDINDLSDLGFLATAYGTTAANQSFNDRCDFNADGVIDLADLGWLASNYGLKGDRPPQ